MLTATVVMELARVCAMKRPKATMIFAAVAGEEQNLYGSNHLAQALKNAPPLLAGTEKLAGAVQPISGLRQSADADTRRGTAVVSPIRTNSIP